MEEIIIVVFVSILDVAINYKWIEVYKIDLNENDNTWRFPSHKWSTIVRGALLAIVGLFRVDLLLCVPLYWFIFHYGLNIVRKKPLLYLGSNKIDKMLSLVDSKVGGSVRFVIHLMLTVIITWMS